MKLARGLARILQKEFGDLEVVDAKENLRLQPMAVDVATAIRKDPSNCVFARCAQRQFGASAILFWKTAAYVDLVGFDGVRRIERFRVGKDVCELIKAFDRGEPFNEGRAFVLRKPSYSAKLTTIRRQGKWNAQNSKPKARRARENAFQVYFSCKDRIIQRKKELQTTTNPQTIEKLKTLIKNAKKRLPELEKRMKKTALEAKRAGCKDHVPHSVKRFDVRFGGFGAYNIIERREQAEAVLE